MSNNMNLLINSTLHIEDWLTIAFVEIIFNKIVVNLSVRDMRSLFQTIQGLFQFINFIFFTINNKALRLFNINLFFQLSIQKKKNLCPIGTTTKLFEQPRQ